MAFILEPEPDGHGRGINAGPPAKVPFWSLDSSYDQHFHAFASACQTSKMQSSVMRPKQSV
jgi:hypothetical protein